MISMLPRGGNHVVEPLGMVSAVLWSTLGHGWWDVPASRDPAYTPGICLSGAKFTELSSSW